MVLAADQGLNEQNPVTNRIEGTETGLDGFSPLRYCSHAKSVDTALAWVFGVATRWPLLFSAGLPADALNQQAGMTIEAGKLLVLNLALWYVRRC
jgi:hypothetical protein